MSNREEILKNEFIKCFGDGEINFLSTPGRVELIGNHTDHQGGKVVACTIDVDNLLCFRKNSINEVVIIDKQMGTVKVSLNDLAFKEEEKNTSLSLIKGISYKLKELGYEIGGFCGVCDSKVLPGSGISSSACFEMMIVECFNRLYCDDKLDVVLKAKIGQYAENVYFKKPCGLMDELTIASNGVLAIDFFNDEPTIDKLDFDFVDYGYSMALVDTKATHADLTDEYTAITKEMKEVANLFNVNRLSDISEKTFYNDINLLRNKLKNDRSLLRAIHYFEEDKRAGELAKAINKKDIDECLRLINKSGDSSYKYLQNVYNNNNISAQSLSLALALSEKVLNRKGALRVHGGGFAGTIQAFVPNDMVAEYKEAMDNIFGEGSCHVLKVRKYGGMKVC